jgi:dephospho-CoA kinase
VELIDSPPPGVYFPGAAVRRTLPPVYGLAAVRCQAASGAGESSGKIERRDTQTVDRGKVPIIGIVGGIASGKTLIAQQLAREGAAVVSADALAHEVLAHEEVKRAARKRWGDAIFTAGGQVDRAALAKIVFAPPPDGPRERKYLEQLTHPEIGRLARARLESLGREKTAPAIVLDVPLLFESGWDKFCDKIVYVDAPRDERLSRALARGWTREDFDGREAAQASIETKRAQADVVIDNSASPEAAQAQVQRFWQSLIHPTGPT